MAIRSIRRQATNPLAAPGTPTTAPIYVDSDTNILTMIPAGSGTTEVTIVDVSSTQTLTNKTLTSPVVGGDLGVNDDVSLELGTDDDSVLRHKSATLAANTALTDVLLGTPVVQALAANSLIVSNTTASGDVLIAANRGGASEEYVFADASAGTLTLTGPGGVVSVESGTTEVLRVNSATVIEIPDSVQLTLGTDNDSVAMHKETSTTANTAVTGALVGTPVVQALAANSTIISNVTASGDILIAAQRGGNSEEYFMADASAGDLFLTSPNSSGKTVFENGTTEQARIDSTGLAFKRSAETVTAANVITAVESGKVFFLSSASEFASTLPAPAAGLHYLFIVTAAPSGASYTVVTEGGCQVLAGHVLTSGFADSGSDVETTATGTTVTFVDGVSVVGDRAELFSDGTSWFASCICAVEAGITITG